MIEVEILLRNQVSIGQEFKSYADLCKHIGIPATTGKQRTLDQRHMKCYFDWKKAERGNKLTITDTYYDNPKEFVDNRNGTHITPTIEMMMNLFLNTEWKKPFYSKTKMLYEMELFNEEIGKKATSQDGITFRITVEKDYFQKIRGHLLSTITQINKSNYGFILPKVVNIKTQCILPNEQWNIFYNIRDKALEKFNESNEGDIYKHKKWNAYREEIDTQTEKLLYQSPVCEIYHLFIFPPPNLEPVSRVDFLKHIGEQMVKTYTKKRKGSIGCVSPEAYKEGVDNLLSELLGDYMSKQAEIEANLQASKKVVHPTFLQ